VRRGARGGVGQTVQVEGNSGLLGPDSVAWELHASPAMLTAGLRALLLQVWHPSIATAVAVHSAVARDPWHRYQSTVAFVSSVTYGDREEAEIAISRVRAVHATVRGVDSRGVPYTADDPGLLAYVHATLVDSALRAADVYGPRLEAGERDRYVAEMATIARRLGVTDPPRDAADAAAVITGNQAVANTRRGRDLAWLLALPPLPIWLRPPYGVLFASAVDLLPRECAVDLGLLPVWSPARPAVRASTAALLHSATFATSWRPARHALRRVARRNFAAG
jgi:uncharacterized protein (DUF2236 family)